MYYIILKLHILVLLVCITHILLHQIRHLAAAAAAVLCPVVVVSSSIR